MKVESLSIQENRKEILIFLITELQFRIIDIYIIFLYMRVPMTYMTYDYYDYI